MVEILKKSTFDEVIREKYICPLMNQYIFTYRNGYMYVHMTSSKIVRTRHHICRFLHRSLVLKIHPNPCQMPRTTAKSRKKHIAKSEGAHF